MPLLYYWRGDNYRRDLDYGVGYHLNQASPALHRIEFGDSLWAFTRRSDGAYVLAAELVIKAKTLNPDSFRYGRYRLWGDLQRSRYFATEGQPDITLIIRGLTVRAGGDVLGRAFQGHAAVRQIAPADHSVLAQYAQALPIEPRARLVPEERLEALLLAGDINAVESLMREEGGGLAEARRRYLTGHAVRRDPGLVQRVRDRYDGTCQVTGWDPRRLYGIDVCEVHHVRWLSRGGRDEMGNMVLLAPNIHRLVHRLDSPFDWERRAFVSPRGDIALTRVEHALLAE